MTYRHIAYYNIKLVMIFITGLGINCYLTLTWASSVFPNWLIVLMNRAFSTWIRSSFLSKGISLFASFIGSLQPSITRGIVRRFLGPSWSVAAVDVACCHLLKVSSELLVITWLRESHHFHMLPVWKYWYICSFVMNFCSTIRCAMFFSWQWQNSKR